MVQKIVTGGNKSTSTAMLKFLMKDGLLEPDNDARHMEHCPNAEVATTSTTAIAAKIGHTIFNFEQMRINVLQLPPVAAFP
jgi:hypothetical protein